MVQFFTCSCIPLLHIFIFWETENVLNIFFILSIFIHLNLSNHNNIKWKITFQIKYFLPKFSMNADNSLRKPVTWLFLRLLFISANQPQIIAKKPHISWHIFAMNFITIWTISCNKLGLLLRGKHWNKSHICLFMASRQFCLFSGHCYRIRNALS